jgi:hypothetical protein
MIGIGLESPSKLTILAVLSMAMRSISVVSNSSAAVPN